EGFAGPGQANFGSLPVAPRKRRRRNRPLATLAGRGVRGYAAHEPVLDNSGFSFQRSTFGSIVWTYAPTTTCAGRAWTCGGPAGGDGPSAHLGPGFRGRGAENAGAWPGLRRDYGGAGPGRCRVAAAGDRDAARRAAAGEADGDHLYPARGGAVLLRGRAAASELA